MSVNCIKCARQWNRDPALEVPCPACAAPIGHRCKGQPPGATRFHVRREYLAIERGFTERCTDGFLHDVISPEPGSLFQKEG